MNGGAWERTMGVLNEMSGEMEEINSGFNGILAAGGSYTNGIPFPSEKYYDLYTNEDQKVACNGEACWGDVIAETSGWYQDHISFVNTPHPWSDRGGSGVEGVDAGLFSFTDTRGVASWNDSFRVVLSAS